MTEFTQEERDIVRASAFGAIALVSRCEPGFIAMFQESVAGSRSIASAPTEIRELIVRGGLVPPATGSAGEVETSVLVALGQAVRILQAKPPELLADFRAVVLAACDAVAGAARGVSAEETEMIGRVRDALAGNGGQAPTPPVPQDIADSDGLLGSTR